MDYESEKTLEEKLINQLYGQDYEIVEIPDEEALINNFRKQLFEHNKESLKNKPFTDMEFKKVMSYLEGRSIFGSAKVLRDTFPLERDNGEKVRIGFLNMKNDSWCQNIYQVTHQTTVNGKRKNRYDVTLLINGLPLVQIELKRRGIDMKEAFNQIKRYKKESYTGLYKYIQIFVVSNGVNAKYFANSDSTLNYTQTFFWTDEKNKRISKLTDFAYSFLEPCFISKVISKYMVINETEKNLMVMRPYQIYAVESAIKLIKTNHHENGYIWHTTGSGKTLTSFKLSQLLAKIPGISKVFFLVDRRDLDNQTLSEFNKFEKGCVDTTSNTHVLVEQIKRFDKPLIVTTIQKLSHAIKSPKYVESLEQYKNDKVIFIIDECHRSQFGEMHKTIQKYFNNAQYIGFTGTPIFSENKGTEGKITTDIFGRCLHTYLINDAINDKNVLGFSVEYINTIIDKSDKNDKTKVLGIDTDEVFFADKRISNIVENIVNIHDIKTNNRKFNAILTVPTIAYAIKYYNIFKKVQHNLKIATIFTFGANDYNEDKDETYRDSLEIAISDYNNIFDTNFNTDNFSGYFADVSKRVKDAEIDILIVVNMFLTGFDAKTLNTLYVDKELEYHSLLQAFSRTNRNYGGEKPYGNIVCYRNLKEKVDKSIALFSQSDNLDIVLMKSYEEYLLEFKYKLIELNNITSSPEEVDNLYGEEATRKFVLNFRELTRVLNRLKTFTEFNFSESEIGISRQTYEDYKSKYLELYDRVNKAEKISILNDIDFEIELMNIDKINVDYIMKLISRINLKNKEKTKKKSEEIKKYLDSSANKSLRLKTELLKEFLDKIIPKMGELESIDERLEQYMSEAKEKEIIDFSTKYNLDVNKLKDLIYEQEFTGFIKNESIEKIMSHLKFMQKVSTGPKIREFIYEHIDRFSY